MRLEANKQPIFLSFYRLIFILLLALVSSCGGNGSSSGASSEGDGDLFSDSCGISDPGFPFCGGNWVRCRNQDKTLYQVYQNTCPAGWTIVPDGVAFPNLACTNPQGRTFNVDGDQCPPGWTEFTINL